MPNWQEEKSALSFRQLCMYTVSFESSKKTVMFGCDDIPHRVLPFVMRDKVILELLKRVYRYLFTTFLYESSLYT